MSVSFQPAPGALLRVLGLVERRGFTITRVQLHPGDGPTRASLGMDLFSEDRSIRNLRDQVMKLVDVAKVQIIASR